jgi:hypothetical protein
MSRSRSPDPRQFTGSGFDLAKSFGSDLILITTFISWIDVPDAQHFAACAELCACVMVLVISLLNYFCLLSCCTEIENKLKNSYPRKIPQISYIRPWIFVS